MGKYNRLLFFAGFALALIAARAVAVSAMVPYKTYTYDSYGSYFLSPNAYVPDKVAGVKEMGVNEFSGGDGGLTMAEPTDLFVDGDNNVYIAESGRNRVIVLDPDLVCVHILEHFTGEDGSPDTFNAPTGVFVNELGMIYVADSKNRRIVIFNPDFTLDEILPPPQPESLPEGFVYEPFSLVADAAGKIYVVARSTNMGLVAFNPDGSFDGFIGATRTRQNLLGFFMQLIQSDEMRARSWRNVPTEYNNIAIDRQGFLYVTTSALPPDRQYMAMVNGDKTTDDAPIKRLNAVGTDVLKRNGIFPPAGDIQVDYGEVTRFIDVTVTVNNTYSVLDAAKNRVFTYDDQGRFLYAFGGTGTQDGVFQRAAALAYQNDGNNLLVLDAATGRVTRFTRTAYGEAISGAIDLQMNRRYEESEQAWREILKLNTSLDIAYVGIGLTNMRQDKYAEAMENFKIAMDWENYFRASGEKRKEDGRIYLLAIPLGAIAVLFALSRFFKYANKKNRAQLEGRKATLWEEFLYGFHIIFHPFDGFWDLKFEKRGGVRGAILIVALVLLSNAFSVLFSGYAVYPTDWRELDFSIIMPILLPLLLWCVSNWALTTLMDGKGTMKDIFVATCYGLMPLALLTVPAAIFSNFVLDTEVQFITMLNTFALGWSFLLIFVGALVTNAYGFLKNLATTALSGLGMAFISFLVIVFINLISNMWTFGNTVYQEIAFRM